MKMNLQKIAMGLGLSIALVACSKDEETIVGTRVAFITCRDVNAGLKVQETVIGVVPVATLLKHPGIRFPAIVKVTRPAPIRRLALIFTALIY